MTVSIEHDRAWRIGDQLGELYASRRREALFRAISVVLMTPLLVALAILVFFMMTPVGGRQTSDWIESPAAPVTVPIALLVGMFFAYLFSPPPRAFDWKLVTGAFLALAAMAGMAQLPPVWRTAWFWVGFGALGILTLALLGMAYEPKDHYYLGWFAGRWDNPFTLRDDIDRRHLALGFVIAFPTMLLGAWSDLFGSAWTIGGLGAADRARCARLLADLGTERRAAGVATLQAEGDRAAARVLRLLSKLELVRPSASGLELTERGAELVANARSLRGG